VFATACEMKFEILSEKKTRSTALGKELRNYKHAEN
jgi:hypothetical protein